MAPRFKKSFAEVHPWALAQWAEPDVDPYAIAPTSPKKIQWVCSTGHSWVESLVVRVSLPKWKRGDVAACPHCAERYVRLTWACGHTITQATTDAGKKRVRAANEKCWPCREAEAKVESQRWCDNLPAAKAELLALMEQHRVPRPLRYAVLGSPLVGDLNRAMMTNDAGLRGNVVGQLRYVTPTQKRCEADPVVRVGGRIHLSAAWRHWHGETFDRVLGDPHFFDALDLREVIATCRQFGYTTAQMTKAITDEICNAAKGSGLQPYRELGIPVLVPGSENYGRVDLCLLGPGHPVIAIEIDSSNNRKTIPKLNHLVASGVETYWLRWNVGPLTTTDGVTLVDLRQPKV